MPPRRTLLAVALAAILFLPLSSLGAAVSSSPAAPLTIDGLGKGAAPLAGPWQFHLGDNPAWAAAGVDDATGHNGWEQLTAAAPWGTQGHASYTGYAWYRRQLNITPAPEASPDVALLIPQIDDVYEIYWNGVPVGHLGKFPPRMDPLFVPPQIYNLGPARSGVLAVRVFKLPAMSTDDGTAGGFEGLPLVGSPEGIGATKFATRYHWLGDRQFLLSGTWYSFSNIVDQGTRFTHWTLGAKMQLPIFTVFGSSINVQLLLRTLLFLAIVYAVVRYSIAHQQRQTNLEREFQNARELQQILVPETLPEIPGFTLTSAHRPAQEVGGDFFQIIPLEGAQQGSTLIVLGDVSGKGLKAAMSVSLIIGAVRTLAKFAPQPAQMLAEINQRLHGRLQNGFATCIVLLLNPAGASSLSSAGHPGPYLNERELELPGALPLGLDTTTTYQQVEVQLKEGDHFSLYTDGLLEARNHSGELYGFERLEVLFGTRPSASRASEEAVAFGQEDDVTVLTLTRLAAGEKSVTVLSAPVLAGS